jgi:hypothetical protein
MSSRFRFAILTVLFTVSAAPVFAAPGPKDSDNPLPPIQPAHRLKSSNNLKQIGLAMHGYHDKHGSLPGNLMTKDNKPGLSWRVAILPFIEEEKLFNEFKLDEPWDSEHNIKLADRMPKLFVPVRGKAEKNQTFYQMFAGENTLLGKVRLTDVTDGLSNTFMVAEAEKPVTWTKPDDMPFDGKKVPSLGGMFDGEFHVLLGDGSVQRIPKGVDATTLLSSITRNGGEVIDLAEAIKNVKE